MSSRSLHLISASCWTLAAILTAITLGVNMRNSAQQLTLVFNTITVVLDTVLAISYWFFVFTDKK